MARVKASGVFSTGAALGQSTVSDLNNKIDDSCLDIATGADVTAGTANKLLDASKVTQTVTAASTSVPSNAAVTAFLATFTSPLLSTTTGINLKTAASTLLYTVPATKTLVDTYAVVHITAASAITTGAVAGYGSNGTQDNLFFPQELSNALAAGDTFTMLPFGKGVVVPAAGAVDFGVDTVAVGTSQVATVYLFGTIV
jgi:hypothetical protein